MVEASEFQKGEQHMLRKVIMLSKHHKNIKELTRVLEEMLLQHENIFIDDDYLKLY